MILSTLKNTTFENIEDSNGIFTKHFHDTYTIGITHDGFFKSIKTHESTLSYKHSTRVINPGEIHHGDSCSWKYTNFYPDVDLLAQIYEQIFFEKRVPIFSEHIIEDIVLYQKLLRFFQSAYLNASALEIETHMIDTLSYLIQHCATQNLSIEAFYKDPTIIHSALEYIHDSLDTNIALDDLSLQTGLSKFHFLRTFKKQIGLTPHQYIITQRIFKARELILKGQSLSQASFQVGFNDQSHFGRNFRKIYGYSPKTLLKKSNFILYK